ncbi:DoxX family protein [Kutzneria kofuensis]|uniref:Putative oxidoreductase n=1 Tax=Kutzneria kofuensis TaxID=103725 RepID=A0A7W9KPK0_9PSEU|nr:DoxX family protein [Kutzneria kofuensis]MBB5896383.1 putative oxidoreductase [Kutzneria kofuensis]
MRSTDTGLLMVRLVAGLTMAAHGTQYLFGWFGGGGLSGAAAFFARSGYRSADLMAVVAGLSETLGGLGLAAGLLTPLAAAAIVGTMVNAMAVKWSGGFFAPRGIEYELLMAVSAAAVAIAGPGRFAADRFVPVLRAHRVRYGVAAVVLGIVVAVVTLTLFR